MEIQSDPYHILDEGFTILHEAKEVKADVIFVHGLQGHPCRTWAVPSAKRNVHGTHNISSLLAKVQIKSNTTNNEHPTTPTDSNTSFVLWPRDFLPVDCEQVRILTWGYQSNITRFFAGPANQGNIFDHARNLLYAINRIRSKCRGRPIIFICHSLGGIIVKETLRRSEADDDSVLRDIVQTTRAIFFLGTPHRGSQYAPYGETLRRVVSAAGFSTNDSNVHALQHGSLELQLSQEEFLKIWRKRDLMVRTFQESSGMSGIKPFAEKVVPDISSSFEDSRERAQHLPGNHMEMCRFRNRSDPGYTQVCGELLDCLNNLSPGVNDAFPALSGVLALNTEGASRKMLRANCQKILESLEFPHMFDRQQAIKTPYHGTGSWHFKTPEYLAWERGECQFLWLKGKPGAGKSTIMKNTRSVLLRKLDRRNSTIASYFFDGSGSNLERSTLGLLQSILYQIFAADQELLELFVSGLEDGRLIKGKALMWQLEELMEVFSTLVLLPKWKPAILILDGLDECPRDEVLSLLLYFQSLIPSTTHNVPRRLRCFLSSRHYPSIFLKDCPEIRAEDGNKPDIEVFARQKLSNLSNTSENEQVLASFIDQADGVFIWVDIATTTLLMADTDGEPLERKLQGLQKSPHKLDDYQFTHELISELLTSASTISLLQGLVEARI